MFFMVMSPRSSEPVDWNDDRGSPVFKFRSRRWFDMHQPYRRPRKSLTIQSTQGFSDMVVMRAFSGSRSNGLPVSIPNECVFSCSISYGFFTFLLDDTGPSGRVPSSIRAGRPQVAARGLEGR